MSDRCPHYTGRIVSEHSLNQGMNSATPLSMLGRNNNNNNDNNNNRVFIQDTFSTKYCYQRDLAD